MQGGGPALNLPMVVGPIAVVYNLDGVDDLSSKPATLAKIFSGKITKWNDPAIKADNPSATSCRRPTITTVHRADDSGTTDNFTKYLSGAAASDWTYDHGKAWKAPGGQAAKGSDGVASTREVDAGHDRLRRASFAENSNAADGEDHQRCRRVRPS